MTQVDTRAPASFWLGGFGQGADIGDRETQVLMRLQAEGRRLMQEEAARAQAEAEWQRSLPTLRKAYHDILAPRGGQPMMATGPRGLPIAGLSPSGFDDELHDAIDKSTTPRDFEMLDHWVKNENRRGVIAAQVEAAKQIRKSLKADSPTRWLLEKIESVRDPAARAKLLQRGQDEAERMNAELAAQAQAQAMGTPYGIAPDVAGALGPRAVAGEVLDRQAITAKSAAQQQVDQAGTGGFRRLQDGTSVDRVGDFALARKAGLVNQEQVNISGRESAVSEDKLLDRLKKIDESTLPENVKASLKRPILLQLGATPDEVDAPPAPERKAKTRGEALEEAVRALNDAKGNLPDDQIEAWVRQHYPSFAKS